MAAELEVPAAEALRASQFAYLQSLGLDRVVSVYVGRAGACMCGCAGRHVYTTKHRELGQERRGYPIDDNEVDDKFALETLRRVQAAACYLDAEYCLGSEGYISVTVGKKDLVLYLTD